MKVILQKEVDKLGAPGDLVDVADGYARNYLIPRKLAAPATKGGVKHSERLKRAHEDRVRRAVGEAQSVADRLTGTKVRITARAGEDGRLFGSITVAGVADALSSAAGTPIDRHDVNLPEPIRSTGVHEVVVRLHPQVAPTVSVEVVPQ